LRLRKRDQNIRNAAAMIARTPMTTPMATFAPVERPLELLFEAGTVPGRADGALEELDPVDETVVPERAERVLDMPETLDAVDEIVPTEAEEVWKDFGTPDGVEGAVEEIGMTDDAIEDGATEEVVGGTLLTDVTTLGLSTEGDGDGVGVGLGLRLGLGLGLGLGVVAGGVLDINVTGASVSRTPPVKTI
jgi:hypothetical protein